MSGSERLSAAAHAIIEEPTHRIYVSSISVWEVVLKSQVGKLKVEGDLVGDSAKQGINLLPFTAAHAQAVGDLPLHHRDPFDRALIAQSVADRLTFVTSDKELAAYAPTTELILAV